MKLKFTILVSVFISAFIIAKAQTVVPNANMESWIHTGTYDNPTGWSTPNSLIHVAFKDSITVLDGNYAARLVCTSILGITVPGVMGTGTLTVDIVNQDFSFTGGFPLTDTGVTAMIGYYKYTPVGSDSCLMLAQLTKWNTLTNQRDTVAITSFVSGGTSGYTFFASPFFWIIPGEKPDTAQIICLTAANYNNAQIGSTLWIDDIDFTNDVGIPGVQNTTLAIFPNPADESLKITLPKEINAGSIIVSNVNGTVVKEMKINAPSEVDVKTASFPPGSYVVFARNEEGNIVAIGRFTVNH